MLSETMLIRVWIIIGVFASISLALHFVLAWMTGRGHIAVRILLRVVAALFMTLCAFAGLALAVVGGHGSALPKFGRLAKYYFPSIENTIDIGALNDLSLIAIIFFLAFPLGWIIERAFRRILPRRESAPEIASYFE